MSGETPGICVRVRKSTQIFRNLNQLGKIGGPANLNTTSKTVQVPMQTGDELPIFSGCYNRQWGNFSKVVHEICSDSS